MINVDQRVTVGLPVRNGAETIREMLESLVRQTHKNITVVVMDNCSSDGTGDIVREFVERDNRIHYIRHETPLTMMANWRSAYEQCHTPYFMWAADDDVLSDDYVELLLAALEAAPEAGLAFGQVVKSYEGDYRAGAIFEYDCKTRGRGWTTRLLVDKQGGFAIYGLFRSDVLSQYQWHEHTLSPDWPLMIHVVMRTEIVQVDGPVLYYRSPPKGADERAQRQSYRGIESYPTARLAWSCGIASRSAAAARGARRSATFDASLVFAGLLWMNRRSIAANVVHELRSRRRQTN